MSSSYGGLELKAMSHGQEADIRRAIIAAFGDKPSKLKKVLKVLEKMIPEMQGRTRRTMGRLSHGKRGTSMTEWNSGPPPSLGWWPCRLKGFPDNGCLRWWDGVRWSYAVCSNDMVEYAAQRALHRTAVEPEYIYWSARPDSWPERSKT